MKKGGGAAGHVGKRGKNGKKGAPGIGLQHRRSAGCRQVIENSTKNLTRENILPTHLDEIGKETTNENSKNFGSMRPPEVGQRAPGLRELPKGFLVNNGRVGHLKKSKDIKNVNHHAKGQCKARELGKEAGKGKWPKRLPSERGGRED